MGGTLSYHLVPTVLRHITKSLNRAGLRTLRVDLRRFNILYKTTNAESGFFFRIRFVILIGFTVFWETGSHFSKSDNLCYHVHRFGI